MKTLQREDNARVSGGIAFSGQLCMYNHENLENMGDWSSVPFTGLAFMRSNEAGQCEMLFYPTDTQVPFHFVGAMAS